MEMRMVRWGAVIASVLVSGVSSVSGGVYSSAGTFARPGADNVSWDVLADGRLIAIDDQDLLVQDSINGSSYSKAGQIPAGLLNGGASFVEVSPDGSTLAFGDGHFGAASNPQVHFVEMSSLDPAATSPVSSVGAANFQGAWVGSTLFVSGADSFGASSFVTRIDASNLGALAAEVAIENVGGSSGGVASDGTHLYTSNGFDNGPGGSDTGSIRAIGLDGLTFGADPLNFEADGIEIAEVLSGSPLGFDHLGNLLVGGGDFSEPDHGYAGVIDASAVLAAISGSGPAAGPSVQHLAPGGAFDFYSIHANHATSEVLVTFYGDSTVYRYAIPQPGTSALVALGAWAYLRRRRDET